MDFIINIGELFCIYAMITISMNFLLGSVGVFYIGHIAFFAIGAYSTAILGQVWHLSPILSLTIATIGSLIIALVIGKIFVRLAGHYLLIASLGICEITRSILNNSKITGGAQGITVINSVLKFSAISASNQVAIAIVVFLITEIIFFFILLKTPAGRLFQSIGADRIIVTAMGYDVTKLRIKALMISVFWVTIAGFLYAHYALYIDPTSFTVQESLLLFIGILIGGLGSLRGSLFASFILIIVPVFLRFVNISPIIASASHQILFAGLLIVILKLRPNGFFGQKTS